METTPVNIIAAVDLNGGIGLNGGLPWRITEDWSYFLNLVTRFLNINTMLFTLDHGLHFPFGSVGKSYRFKYKLVFVKVFRKILLKSRL